LRVRGGELRRKGKRLSRCADEVVRGDEEGQIGKLLLWTALNTDGGAVMQGLESIEEDKRREEDHAAWPERVGNDGPVGADEEGEHEGREWGNRCECIDLDEDPLGVAEAAAVIGPAANVGGERAPLHNTLERRREPGEFASFQRGRGQGGCSF